MSFAVAIPFLRRAKAIDEQDFIGDRSFSHCLRVNTYITVLCLLPSVTPGTFSTAVGEISAI